MTRTRACPIRTKLTRNWIPEEKELGHLILPSDSRYYKWGFCGGPLLVKEKQQINERLLRLLQADILRVSPEEMPTRLPERLPEVILQAWAKEDNIPLKKLASWIDRVDRPSKEWCHHDPELGYSVAKLLCVRFKSRLIRGWRVLDKPGYAGGEADLGLIDPKGECIIAVEIGNTEPKKFEEAFLSPKLRQLWYFHYQSSLSGPHYEWEKKGVYFVWTRGPRWEERKLYAL